MAGVIELSRKHSATLLAVVSLGALTSCAPDQKPEAPPPLVTPHPDEPNVILISIDTLRPDHLGCYGYQPETSPRIDQLAAQGILFENAISSTSWTLPAHAALFSSLPDTVHGCTDSDRRLPDNIVTLAERFASAGYATAGFFSGPFLHPVFGFSQGFDHYENCTSYAQSLDDPDNPVPRDDLEVMRRSHQDITNPAVYQAVSRWLQTNAAGGKFFMFIHMWDVHFDFIPPPPYDKLFDPFYSGPITGKQFFFDRKINAAMPKRDLQHLIALYDGEIAWTDHHVGKLVDYLAQAGLLDSTVLAITADHGTEFFEHGGKAHRMTLFDEVIRIPLVIRFPPALPAGRRITPQTRIIDIGPTLLDLAGLAQPTDVMGHSLGPLIRTGEPGFDNLAISELFSVGRRMRTARTLEWKFFDVLEPRQQYYMELTSDPGELRPWRNLSMDPGRQHAARYQAALADLSERRAGMPAAASQPALPDDVRQQLEGLGYVDKQDEE